MGLRKVGKLKMAVFLFLFFSMQLLPALTSPVAFPVVVVLSGDEPVMYTANKIGELLQNAMVVEKESVFGTLILMRAVGEVIYVGHGTQQGIKVGGNIVSWESFTEEIRHIPSKTIYVAACYSENLAKIEKTKMVFGFKGLVDVDEAAYLTTATIAAAKGDMGKAQKLLKELTEIMIGKIIEPWKYKLWLLYETKKIRGIWHVKYHQYHPEVVEYTHPDNYIHYSIGINEWWSTGDPSNLWVLHIPKDVASLPPALLGAAVGAVIGAAIGGLSGALIGAIVGAIIGWAGEVYIPDENGESWAWIKDYTVSWWVIQKFDFKIGGICWCHIEVFPWYPGYVWWPLWYGWKPYLGLDGW